MGLGLESTLHLRVTRSPGWPARFSGRERKTGGSGKQLKLVDRANQATKCDLVSVSGWAGNDAMMRDAEVAALITRASSPSSLAQAQSTPHLAIYVERPTETLPISSHTSEGRHPPALPRPRCNLTPTKETETGEREREREREEEWGGE